MNRRARAASIAAVTATLLTGGVAVAATTGALTSADRTTAGTVQLVDESRGVSVPPGAAATPAAAEPSGIAAGGAPTAASPAPAGEAQLVAAPAASVTPAGSDGSGGSPPAPAKSGSNDGGGKEPPPTTQPTPPPTPPSTPPTTASQPPPTSGGWNCSGSDDGLTEAQKRAREAACHGGGDD